jgi:hypothetical protein
MSGTNTNIRAASVHPPITTLPLGCTACPPTHAAPPDTYHCATGAGVR